MHHSTDKEEFAKKRKPVIILVCEGRNKTERNYFKHFIDRDAPYVLKVKPSEATDIKSMAELAGRLFRENQIDRENYEHVYCLIDLDLDEDRFEKYLLAKKEYSEVEFILSNPCFEIWLLYYFTQHPKVELSSQNVKKQLRKYIPGYTENMDVVSVKKLEEKYAIAIDRSEKKNYLYQNLKEIEKNPYTEVQDIIVALTQIEK